MFNFSFDKRMVYVIIVIMVLSTISGYMRNPGELFFLLVSIPGVLVAITFHEFAHGLAAYKLGDNTAKNEGRLSLNPFDHLDPIGLLCYYLQVLDGESQFMLIRHNILEKYQWKKEKPLYLLQDH